MQIETIKRLTLSLLMSFSFSSMAKSPIDKVIYGNDDRQDLRDSKLTDFQQLAVSTAVQIPSKYYTVLANGNLQLDAKETLQSQVNVCDDEPFAKQLAVGNCSGFLVSADLLVTAGHCMDSQSDCDDMVWAFDYAEGKMTDAQVPKENVYRCTKILKQALDHFSKNDYAVIKLDRPVTNRAPLNFRLSGPIKMGEALVVIGHPSGLPAKIAGGSTMQNADHDAFFKADLDTYGGNSGSAVFNAQSKEVEGILVRGAKDYVIDTARGCYVSNRCDKMDPDNTICEGESVSRISAVDIVGLEMTDLLEKEPTLTATLAIPNTPDSQGQTLLMAAAKHGKYPLVRALLSSSGLEALNKKSASGDTALHLSIKANDYYTTKLLLEKGADFSTKGQEKVKAKKLSKKLKQDKRFQKLMREYDKWYLPGKH